MREIDVLRLVADDKSNRRRGSLTLSERTVEHHVSNIYAKAGVHNRAEAVAWGPPPGSGIEGWLTSSPRAARLTR